MQVTFQACDLQEGRLLYDQLAVVCPIMVWDGPLYDQFIHLNNIPQLSVSAATPVLRGYLSDLDCRWNVISSSVDDRTPEERGVKVQTILVFPFILYSLSPSLLPLYSLSLSSPYFQPLNKSPFTIPTSRYDTIDCYLSNGDYNDKPVLYDQKVLQTLIDGGWYNLTP